mmetsp:Transcript_6010/g.11027  ORF Transcript_6010/g.11027 Transcript_6010/m.11027 type:complete len:301 (+) Transcript_6010:968-1870(+)
MFPHCEQNFPFCCTAPQLSHFTPLSEPETGSRPSFLTATIFFFFFFLILKPGPFTGLGNSVSDILLMFSFIFSLRWYACILSIDAEGCRVPNFFFRFLSAGNLIALFPNFLALIPGDLGLRPGRGGALAGFGGAWARAGGGGGGGSSFGVVILGDCGGRGGAGRFILGLGLSGGGGWGGETKGPLGIVPDSRSCSGSPGLGKIGLAWATMKLSTLRMIFGSSIMSAVDSGGNLGRKTEVAKAQARIYGDSPVSRESKSRTSFSKVPFGTVGSWLTSALILTIFFPSEAWRSSLPALRKSL